MSFNSEEIQVLLELCEKKIKGIDWVLKEKTDLKEDKKTALTKKKEMLSALVEKLENNL